MTDTFHIFIFVATSAAAVEEEEQRHGYQKAVPEGH